jgi:hypothetical protein
MSRIVRYRFVDYGEPFEPAPDTLVLDVGMKTVPGVVDHHQPDAEPECAASLVAKYPGLVLDHLAPAGVSPSDEPLTIVTHRLPDFDSLAAIYISLKILETGRVDDGLLKIAAYTKLIDSALLPKTVDLAGTPHGLLRALFSGSKKSEEENNRDRLEEGLKLMRALHARASEGLDILEDEQMFAGIDRYDRARKKVRGDYTTYVSDLVRGRFFFADLPAADGSARRTTVNGLVVANPRSFLLKEWAHRDREHPSLGDGYSFIVSSFGEAGCSLGVDPGKGVNLRGLGARLEAREREKRAAAGRAAGRTWYEGNCPLFDYRIIVSPQGGTALTTAEVMEEVLAFGGGSFEKKQGA